MTNLSENEDNQLLENLYNNYFVEKREKEAKDEQHAIEQYQPIPSKEKLSKVEDVLFDRAQFGSTGKSR